MSEKVKLVQVSAKDSDCRLDRWFKRYYPELKHGTLQKLLRGKNIRVNGKKAFTGLRVFEGDEIRIPTLKARDTSKKQYVLSDKEVKLIQSCVIYKDEEMIVLNKPAGLAVQGGSKQTQHVDRLLEGLQENEERPKLVHRLDKETSGILVLARTSKVAQKLSRDFQTHKIQKVYWAIVEGCPRRDHGKVEVPLLKRTKKGLSQESRIDDETRQQAISLYRVVDTVPNRVSWLELRPLTGRKHQLRAHCAYLGTPILGDGKYTPKETPTLGLKDERKMHLHARAIKIPHPVKGMLEISAKIPQHIKNTFDFLEFDEKQAQNGFGFFEHGRN